ncbi:hypothetical protein BDF19DRAFT_453336 [Syncephalis fuscata]|nr:hypothetical protein BDF19DRAFT_453336 [Syncephalis fuscata]
MKEFTEKRKNAGLSVQTDRAAAQRPSTFDQNSPFLDNMTSDSDLFLDNLAANTANQDEDIFAQQPPSFGALANLPDFSEISAAIESYRTDHIRAALERTGYIPDIDQRPSSSLSSTSSIEAGNRAIIIPDSPENEPIQGMEALKGHDSNERNSPICSTPAEPINSLPNSQTTKHKSTLSADLLKRVNAIRHAPESVVKARQQAMALFDGHSIDVDKSAIEKPTFTLLTSETKHPSKSGPSTHRNPGYGDEGPSGLLEPPDFDASIVQGSDISGSFHINEHLQDISSFSDPGRRDSDVPTGDVLTDEDVHRLIYRSDSKEYRLLSEMQKMMEDVDQSNRFTERQRMEEFMEKKLTSVELQAADLRFTVMKENEPIQYGRPMPYGASNPRCVTTPSTGMTPSHSNSRALPRAPIPQQWRPSMPTLPPSPPPVDQPLVSDVMFSHRRKRSKSHPTPLEEPVEVNNEAMEAVGRASLLPTMSMLVQRLPGWFAGTRYAPPTATTLEAQRRNWHELHAAWMDRLRPMAIKVATLDEDTANETTPVIKGGRYWLAQLLSALTSTYGSIILALIIALEIWLVINTIHQVGLRAIVLDSVHTDADTAHLKDAYLREHFLPT